MAATVSSEPQLAARLDMDRQAPRMARHQVRLLGFRSPDLRDAVVLLTSEVVTRAVEQCEVDDVKSAPLEFRVWIEPDLVRVELRGAPTLAHVIPDLPPWHFDVMLLDSIADRWAWDSGPAGICFWFEIDRRH
jgi:hypothetical protein